jgi:hypothetical protein
LALLDPKTNPWSRKFDLAPKFVGFDFEEYFLEPF